MLSRYICLKSRNSGPRGMTTDLPPLPEDATLDESVLAGMGSGYKGLFITFEGLDGCGKSTQMELLATALRERGYVVLVTREPGGTPLGEAIRQVLLDPRHHGMSARAEALLYAAARAHLVEQVIRPALKDGQVVLCDRYLDSSLAYQGYGRGLGTDDIITLNVWATDCLFPDLTLFLDLDDSIRSTRVAAVPDRLEAEDEDFHRGGRGLSGALAPPSPSHPPGGRPGDRGRGAGAGTLGHRGGARAVQPLGPGGAVRGLFADIVGQEMAVSILIRALEQGPSHAYLFLGPPGVGKTEAALAFAAGLACPDGGCGTCTTCRRVQEGLHPDVEIVSPEGNFIRKEEITEHQPPRRLPALRGPRQGLHLPGSRQLQLGGGQRLSQDPGGTTCHTCTSSWSPTGPSGCCPPSRRAARR